MYVTHKVSLITPPVCDVMQRFIVRGIRGGVAELFFFFPFPPSALWPCPSPLEHNAPVASRVFCESDQGRTGCLAAHKPSFGWNEGTSWEASTALKQFFSNSMCTIDPGLMICREREKKKRLNYQCNKLSTDCLKDFPVPRGENLFRQMLTLFDLEEADSML